MTFKTFYNRLDKSFNSVNSGTIFSDVSLTDQSQAYDADINNIMVDGYVPGAKKVCSTRRPMFGDFTQCTQEKLADSLNTVKKAESDFNNLPSDIRAKFDNNPLKLLEFVNNADNYDEAVKLGLCNPRAEEPQPVKVQVIPSETAGSSSE